MAKKKIKKALKALMPMLAIAGLGKAFMNSRAKPLGVSGADKALFTSNKAMRNSMMQEPFGGMLTDEDYNSPIFTEAAAKKGGRIMKTKKGGRAVRKANRSKKK
jgi:hypothetical protein